MLPPEYGRLYELPSDPVTWTEAALVSVTVKVSDCPADMLPDCAVMETVGVAAEAVRGNNAGTATKARRGHNEASIFTGPP